MGVGISQAQYTQIRSVSTLPATCNPGSGVVPTDVVSLVTGGTSTLYVCSAINTWSPIGGAGASSVLTGPGATQDIFQPLVTGVTSPLTINNLNNIRFVDGRWNWSFTDSAGSIGNLTTAGTGLVLTLPSCPAGIDTNSTANHYIYDVYISGTGTAEPVPVTGGSCTPGLLGGGTVIVTTKNNHPNGYTVGSASTGLQEAWNDAWVNDNGTAPNASSQAAPYMKLESNIPYSVHAAVYLRGRGGVLDGTGALIVCSTRDRCIYSGITNNFPGINYHKIFNLNMTSSVNVDGVQVQSVSAATGTYTVTTAANHPFVTGDWADCEYHSQTADAHWAAQVLTTPTATSFTVAFGASTFSAGATTFGFCNILNAAIEDNSDHDVYDGINIFQANPVGLGFFTYGLVNDNDQQMIVTKSGNRSSIAIKNSANWPMGSFFYERNDQGNNGITYVHDTELTNVNCMTAGGNGVVYSDSVCQGYNVYGIRYFGGLQPGTITNLYEEEGSSTNPLYGYTAGMGLLLNGGRGSRLVGNFPIDGTTPTFPSTGSSCTQRNYYVVPRASAISTGYGPLLYIGSSSTSTCSTSVTLKWPSTNLQDISGATVGTLTWDILATTGTTSPAPFGTGSFLVSGGTGISGSCTTAGICTFTDSMAALSSYTVQGQKFHPTFWFWPGQFVLGGAGGSTASPLFADSISTYTTTASSNGILGISIIAQQCNGFGSSYKHSPLGMSCPAGPSDGGSGIQALVLQQKDQSNNGPLLQAKGRINLGSPIGNTPNDLFTLQDSNFAKTESTSGQRPGNDANDIAIGVDNSGNGVTLRAPSSISEYIGTQPDNAGYVMRKTANLITSKVPVTIAGLNDTCADTSVSANSVTCAMGTGLLSFTSGQLYWIVPANTNTGAVTVTINSIVPVNLTKGGSSAIALQGGEITAGLGFWAYYDGTQLQVMTNGKIKVIAKSGADMALKIRKAISDMNPGSAYLDATDFFNTQTWSVNPFVDLVGLGYLPTKTGVLDIGCQMKADLKMSFVIPTGWEVTGCNNNFVGNQNSVLQADAAQFLGFYGTGLLTCTINGGTPNTASCSVSGGTWTSKMPGAILAACLSSADGHCGSNLASNPMFGTILSVDSATTATVLVPNGGANAVSGVNYGIMGCVACLGDNSTSGAGNQNFGVQIHGVTLDTNGVAGVNALWNSDAANMSRAYNNVYTVSDNIGVAWFGGQNQNGDFDHFWITPGASCSSTGAIGIMVRVPGASTPLSFGDGSIALGGCGTGGSPTGALVDSAFDSETRVVGMHYVTGTGTSNVAIAYANGTPCPYVCPVPPGSEDGAVFSDINASGAGAAVIHVGTTNSPTSYSIEQVKTIASGNNYVNTIQDDTTSCAVTWSVEKTVGKYAVDSSGVINNTTSRVAGCAQINTAGPITAGGSITATGGYVDKTIGYLTNAMGTQNSATPTPITTMSWTLAPNKSYRLGCYLPVLFATSATIAFELVGPGSPTHYTITAQGAIGAAGVWAPLHGVTASTWAAGATGASGAPGSGVTEDILIEAGIQNGSTGGTMTLDSIANGTNNIQMLKDGNCVLTGTN